jgi:hypothetical protein
MTRMPRTPIDSLSTGEEARPSDSMRSRAVACSSRRKRAIRPVLAVLVVVAGLATQGCSYLGDRARDAGDTMDLGFTLSSKPQFAVYGCAFGLGGLGYGRLNGKVLGLFGGRVGLQSLNANMWSAGPIGGETIQVGDKEAVKKCTGAVCIMQRAPEGTTKSSSCCHYLHLGFLGLAGNLHYKEILDCTLGLVGVDICDDDASKIRRAASAEGAATGWQDG